MRFKLWSGVGVCVLGLALVAAASIMGICGQVYAAGDDVACSGSAQPLAGAGDQAIMCNEASRVWENFRTTYSQSNFSNIRAKFSWSFRATSPEVTTLTKEGDQLRDLLDNVEYTYRNSELVRNEGRALMERENQTERLDELPAAVPGVKEKAENKPPAPTPDVVEDGRESSLISRLPVLLAVLMLIILTWGFIGRLFLRR